MMQILVCVRLRATQDQVALYKRKLDVLDDYERQVRILKDEVSFLTAEKSVLQERYVWHENTLKHVLHKFGLTQWWVNLSFRLVRSRSPSPLPRRSRSVSPVRGESPTRAQLTSSSRHARLVSRFSDLYATERLESQSLLRRYIDDLDTVQRIIFIAVVVRRPLGVYYHPSCLTVSVHCK